MENRKGRCESHNGLSCLFNAPLESILNIKHRFREGGTGSAPDVVTQNFFISTTRPGENELQELNEIVSLFLGFYDSQVVFVLVFQIVFLLGF